MHYLAARSDLNLIMIIELQYHFFLSEPIDAFRLAHEQDLQFAFVRIIDQIFRQRYIDLILLVRDVHRRLLMDVHRRLLMLNIELFLHSVQLLVFLEQLPIDQFDVGVEFASDVVRPVQFAFFLFDSFV